MVFPHDSIHLIKCTSFSCRKTASEHDGPTSILHNWDGFPRLTSVLPSISFIRPHDVSLCAFANSDLTFYVSYEPVSKGTPWRHVRVIMCVLKVCPMNAPWHQARRQYYLLKMTKGFLNPPSTFQHSSAFVF